MLALRAPVLLAATAGLCLAATAHGATVRDGSPRIASYRGVPVAVVFVHPL